jgi:transposase
MGVSEAAVHQWMQRAREGGPEALRRRPPPGAPRRLSAEQLARLPEFLQHGPAVYGFRGGAGAFICMDRGAGAKKAA